MVARKTGGQAVPAGFYWNTKDWRMDVVSGEGGVLEGGADARYLRVPTLAMLAAAPLMGLAFVVFLPLVGFVLVGKHFGARALDATRDAASSAADTMTPLWKAGEVHFLGGTKRRAKKDKAAKAPKGETRH